MTSRWIWMDVRVLFSRRPTRTTKLDEVAAVSWMRIHSAGNWPETVELSRDRSPSAWHSDLRDTIKAIRPVRERTFVPRTPAPSREQPSRTCARLGFRSCLSCCRSKVVEWPAKRCYVGLVAVGVQEQAEDILVPPLLRNCLTLNDISFS